jgi:hypothetical protein
MRDGSPINQTSVPIGPAGESRVSVTVTPTFAELFIVTLTLIRYQGALIVLHAIFPVAGLLLLFAPLYVGRSLTMLQVLCAFFALSFTPLITSLSIWRVRRRNKIAQGSFTHSFDSEGIHTSGNTFSQTLKWAAIARVRQSKRFMLFFISPSRAIYVPLAALRDAGILESVRRIAGEHTDFRS